MTHVLALNEEDPVDDAAFDDRYAELHTRIAELRSRAADKLSSKIITIMSPKGGQGKSFFAKELAWLLDAILLDMDWDGGRVSRLLGYLIDKYKNAPLLDALENGKAPRLYRSPRRPDMVPGHPDFEPNQPEPDDMSRLLLSWAAEWKRCVLADSHPGGSPSTLGAAQASDLVVMPLVMGTGELDAVEEGLEAWGHLPLLLVPNITPRILPAAESKRLLDMAKAYGVPIAGTFVQKHTFMVRRKGRTVIAASPKFGENTAAVTTDMIGLAEEVVTYVAA